MSVICRLVASSSSRLGIGAVRPHGARHAGGVHDEVGVLDDVVVLAGHVLHVAADDGRALGDVEALALGDVRALDVHERHRARELALEQLLREHAADVPAADQRDLLQHAMSPPLLGARCGPPVHPNERCVTTGQ